MRRPSARLETPYLQALQDRRATLGKARAPPSSRPHLPRRIRRAGCDACCGRRDELPRVRGGPGSSDEPRCPTCRQCAISRERRCTEPPCGPAPDLKTVGSVHACCPPPEPRRLGPGNVPVQRSLATINTIAQPGRSDKQPTQERRSVAFFPTRFDDPAPSLAGRNHPQNAPAHLLNLASSCGESAARRDDDPIKIRVRRVRVGHERTRTRRARAVHGHALEPRLSCSAAAVCSHAQGSRSLQLGQWSRRRRGRWFRGTAAPLRRPFKEPAAGAQKTISPLRRGRALLIPSLSLRLPF